MGDCCVLVDEELDVLQVPAVELKLLWLCLVLDTLLLALALDALALPPLILMLPPLLVERLLRLGAPRGAEPILAVEHGFEPLVGLFELLGV